MKSRLRQLDATLMAHCAQTDAAVRAWVGSRAAQPDDPGGGGGGEGAIQDSAAHQVRRKSSSKRLSAADREAIVSLTHSEALLRQVSPDAEFELVSSADEILADFPTIEEALPVLSNEGQLRCMAAMSGGATVDEVLALAKVIAAAEEEATSAGDGDDVSTEGIREPVKTGWGWTQVRSKTRLSKRWTRFWFVLRAVPATELLWADTLQQQTGDAKVLEWYICKEDAADREVNPVGAVPILTESAMHNTTVWVAPGGHRSRFSLRVHTPPRKPFVFEPELDYYASVSNALNRDEPLGPAPLAGPERHTRDVWQAALQETPVCNDISPPSWLPDEILLEIFKLVDARTLLLSVTCTNRRWRSLCQGTPGLTLALPWANPLIALPTTPTDPFSAFASVIGTVTDAAVEAMAQRIGFPAVVDLTNCNRVTDDAVAAIALPHRGPSLQRLFLARCVSITSFAVVGLAAHCSNLRELDLSRCRKVDGNVLLALGTHCPKLTSLNLSFTRIGEPFIIHRSLDVDPRVADAVDLVLRSSIGNPLALTALEAPFKFLGAGCPELSCLDVEGCSLSAGSAWLASLGANGGRFDTERCSYPASMGRAAAERALLQAGQAGAYLLRTPYRSDGSADDCTAEYLAAIPQPPVNHAGTVAHMLSVRTRDGKGSANHAGGRDAVVHVMIYVNDTGDGYSTSQHPQAWSPLATLLQVMFVEANGQRTPLKQPLVDAQRPSLR